MRLAVGLTALLLVTACKSEPNFDERYDKANAEIRAKADAIDKELNRRAKLEANVNSGQPTDDTTASPRPPD